MKSGSQAERFLKEAEGALGARDLARALRLFQEAEAHGAEADRCNGGRWLTAMLRGDFEAAWHASDAIRTRGAPDEHRFWQGEDIRGKRVIVRCLHGLGDAVQMLRFAPRLQEIAAHVIYEVPPRFVELAACFPAVRDVITWGKEAPAERPAWDVQVEIMELPYLLRLQAHELPYARDYLKVPEAESVRVELCMGPGRQKRAGIVWTSSEWNPSRCLPVDLVKLISYDSCLEFYSLEHSQPAEQTRELGLRHATATCGDGLLALAATIEKLDLIITVDTLAAHMAGALGKPVWLMLQHGADWRWMHGRQDSPWYPSMRLFRQKEPGDWTGVADAVRRELELIA